ncbi:ATP-grasp domain-containing protein [Nonomuraea jiangxiensis]|nr:ATP-grasp domain-containing protein [Nonomuraea jiangxiensis]
MDAGRLDAAAKELQRLLAGRPLVTAEPFTTSLRTGYTGPAAIEPLRPTLSIGCYPAWTPAMPGASLAAENRTQVRSRAERHGWLARVRHDAERRLVTLDQPPVITAWDTTAHLRQLAGAHSTIAAIDGALGNAIEAKHVFDELLRAAGVPAAVRIPCVHVERLPALAELRSAVGTTTVVVQAGVTSGGRGTVIVSGEEDLPRAAQLLGPYRVAAFVDGWSSNITVLSIPAGDGVRVYVDRPSHRSVGVTELGTGPARCAGDDWSRPWPADAVALIIECAERIADWAWRRYRIAGLFNLDAILTPDQRVYLNEINWRDQGTTEVSAVNQQLRGLPPFIVAHLAVMLGGQVTWLGDPEEFNQDTIAQSGRAGGPYSVKARLTHQAPSRIGPGHPSGVYRLDLSNRLHRVRPGAHPADADTDSDEILLANLPGPDVLCHPGAEIATIEGLTSGGRRPFIGPHSAAAFTLRVHTALHRLFRPCPPAEGER